MSDPNDELLERIKQLKNQKDMLEERMNMTDRRRGFLESSLLNALSETRWLSRDSSDTSETSGQYRSNRKGRCLKESLVTILNWVRIVGSRGHNIDKVNIVKSLNKAILWASQTNHEEEDRVLRKLLEESLIGVLNWVEHFHITKGEENQKQQLMDSLKNAVNWASRSAVNDEIMIDYLTDFIIIARSWTKRAKEEGIAMSEKISDEESKNDEDELDEMEREELAQEELSQSLKAIYNWVKSIEAYGAERRIQQELLESLTMTMNWVIIGATSRDDQIMKGFLQETLILSLNWAMIVDEEDLVKQQLVDYLLFAINWATSYETKGTDDVMRELLRKCLSTAVEWKKTLDRRQET